MYRTYRDILLEILQIVIYPDKEKFIIEFERLNHLDAMTNILPMLSHEVREYIKLNHADPEKITKYIPQERYLKELIRVSASALIKFTEDISPILNAKQREEIVQLLASS